VKIRIGINPLTWSNDDLPSLGAGNSLETCLREASATGYAGVELGHKFPRQAEVLGPLLAQHGLSLVSGWYSLRLLERDEHAEFAAMAPHFDLLRRLGCSVMVACEVTGCIHGDIGARLSARPRLAPHQWARFGDRLTRLADRMHAEGLRLAYHHHMGTVVQSGDEIDALLRHSGESVGLLLDTGHLRFAGDDPVQAAVRHATRIVHVHCKDLRPAVLSNVLNRDSSFLDAVVDGVFTVPGDGCIDYAAVFEPLARAGYAGWLVVEAEQDPVVANPLEYARKGHDYLQRVALDVFR
jgi:inosose dehydratase